MGKNRFILGKGKEGPKGAKLKITRYGFGFTFKSEFDSFHKSVKFFFNLIITPNSLKRTTVLNKIGLLWCHSHVELRLIEVEVD